VDPINGTVEITLEVAKGESTRVKVTDAVKITNADTEAKGKEVIDGFATGNITHPSPPSHQPQEMTLIKYSRYMYDTVNEECSAPLEEEWAKTVPKLVLRGNITMVKPKRWLLHI